MPHTNRHEVRQPTPSIDELSLSSPQGMSQPTEPFKGSHPLNVIKLRTSPVQAGAGFASVQSFRVHYLRANGSEAEQASVFDFEYRSLQDVLDLVAYGRNESGKILIAVEQVLRPAIAARVGLSAQVESGLHWNLPGAYIRQDGGEFSLTATSKQLLSHHLGLQALGELETLGGSYFPSVGGSTECAFPRSVEVKLPKDRDLVGYGAGFEAMRRVKFFSLQEIVNRYFDGTFKDQRLLLAAFRLADREGVSLTVPIKIESIPSVKRENSVLTLRNAAEVRQEGYLEPGALSEIAQVKATPIEGASSSFLKTVPHSVQLVRELGESEDPFVADVVVRKGVDSVDIGCFCQIESESHSVLAMVVKVGVRPSLAVRDLAPHPVHTQAKPLHFEGIAESLEGDSSPKAILERACGGISEEAGVEIAGEPMLIGSGYPSPGTNPECAFSVLVPINPSRQAVGESSVDEVISKYLLPVEAIIELGNQGIVRDPRLLLNAYILRTACGEKVSVRTLSAEESKLAQQLDEIVNSGSRVQYWLARHAREVDSDFSRAQSYRRLKAYCEDELGMVLEYCQHPEERYVFEGFLPHFMIPDPKDLSRLPFHLGHDLMHFVVGSMSAFQGKGPKELATDADGELVPISFEEYRRGNTSNECHAVWYSDVIIPRHFGYEECEEIFGGIPVGKAFEMLGYTTEEARDCIFKIEQSGVIPENIVSHPRYAEVRGIIVGRLLRYNYLDTFHLRRMYDNWIVNPEVAKVALRCFGGVFCDARAHEDYIAKSLERMEAYHEGSNPLRAEMAQTIHLDMATRAMRLAFYKQQILKTARSGAQKAGAEIDSVIHELIAGLDRLKAHNAQITDIDASPKNLSALKALNEARGNEIARALELEERLYASPELLSADQIAFNHERGLPFLRALPFDLSREGKQVINEAEIKSFTAAGVTAPAPYYTLDKV